MDFFSDKLIKALSGAVLAGFIAGLALLISGISDRYQPGEARATNFSRNA